MIRLLWEHAIGLTPLINELLEFHGNVKSVAFADDLTGAGELILLKLWWDKLNLNGPKYGYYPKPIKSYLIVKESVLDEAKNIFEGSEIEITTVGARHLGAALGDVGYKEKYVKAIVSSWITQLKLLSKVAEIHPQAAYSAYINGFQHKFNYTLRTIENVENYLKPIEEVLSTEFIPAITGGHVCSASERKLLSLPLRFGGLGINILTEISTAVYDDSREVTAKLTENVINQCSNFVTNKDNVRKIK